MTPPGRQLRSGGVLRGATSQSEALPADLRIRSTSAPWRDADTNLLNDPVLLSLCALMRSESHRARKPEGHRTRVPDTRGSHKFNMVQFLCGYKRLEPRKANSGETNDFGIVAGRALWPVCFSFSRTSLSRQWAMGTGLRLYSTMKYYRLL